MRRKTALVGFSYLAGMFFASFLSVRYIFLCSAFFTLFLGVLVIFNFKNKRIFITSVCSVIVAMVVYGFNAYLTNKYVLEYDGVTADFHGEVIDYEYTSNDVMLITAKGKLNKITTTITLFAPYQDCEYYDDISFIATYKEIQNNVSFNSKSYNNPNGIYLTAQNPQNIEIKSNGFNLLKSIRNFSDNVYNELVRKVSDNNGAFLGAMLCGNRDYMDDYISSALFKVGIGHIFSVSGTHLVIISFIFTYIFQLLKVSKKTNLILVEIVIVLFAVFAGMSSSIIRSAIMMTIFNLSKLVNRKSDSLTTLAICGILLTIFSPEKIRSASFLLSMSGAFSMAVVTPKVLSEFKYNGKYKNVFESFVGCIVVWVVSTPFVLMYFNEISAFSVLFNLIFLPLCTTALVLTVVGAIPLVFGFAIEPCLDVAGKLVSVVTFFAKHLAKLKFSTVPLGYESVRIVLVICIISTVLLFVVKRKFKPVIKYLLVCISAVVLTYSIQLYNNRNKIEVFVINYKNSFALVLNNNSKAVIIDNDGKISDSTIRVLEYYGIKELSGVVTFKNNERAKGYYFNNTDFMEFNMDNCMLFYESILIEYDFAKVVLGENSLTVETDNNRVSIPYELNEDNENGIIYRYVITNNDYTKGEFQYAFG